MEDDYSAVLWDGMLRFGAYPNNERFMLLMKMGYHTFIDLTAEGECTNSVESGVYPLLPCTFSYIHHPINDKRVPQWTESFHLLLRHVIILRSCNEKVYVHCRGGHGRAALFCACVMATDMNSALLMNDWVLDGNVMRSTISKYYPTFSDVSGIANNTQNSIPRVLVPTKTIKSQDIANYVLKLVYEAHQQRKTMDMKWRKMGAPQTRKQKEFVAIVAKKTGIWLE